MINKEKLAKFCGGAIEICLLAIIFFVPIYFAYFKQNFNIFDLSKIILFRFFLLAALIFFLAKILLERKIVFRINAKIFLFVLSLALSYFLSALFSIRPEQSFWGDPARAQGFYSLAGYLIFFLLLILNLRTERQFKRSLWAVAAAGLLVSLYGLAQRFDLDPLVWRESAARTQRIFSSLGQPNFLGQYLAMILPLTLALGVTHKNFLIRFFLFLLAATELAGLFFTYSRAAWLGFVFSIFVFCLLYLFFMGRKILAWSLLAASAVGFIGIIAFNLFIPNKPDLNRPAFFDRAKSMVYLNTDANKMRLIYWRTAWAGFSDFSWRQKIFGLGPETQMNFFAKYYRPQWGVYERINTLPDRAHNSFFDILLQFGLFGLAAIVTLYGFILIQALKAVLSRERVQGEREQRLAVAFLLSGLAAYFLSNLFGFPTTTASVYLYLFLGLLLYQMNRGMVERAVDLPPLKPAISAVFFAATAAILGFFYYSMDVKLFLADRFYIKEARAEADSDCKKILDNLGAMADANPNLSYYRGKYVYHSLKCFEAVAEGEDRENLYRNISDQIGAIDRREYTIYTEQEIARAFSYFGRYVDESYFDKADAIYRDLEEKYPYITTIYENRGKMFLWQKKYAAAVGEFKKGIAAAPATTDPLLNDGHRQEIKFELYRLEMLLAEAYAREKNWAGALEHYGNAIEINPRNAELYKLVADIHFQQGALDKAIWHNKRGLALSPRDHNWPLNVALLYKQKGDRENALLYAKRAAALEPDDFRVKETLKALTDEKSD